MAAFRHRYPLNAPGKYYIYDQCTDCDLCRESAPNNIRRDDRTGISYVFKQPENETETKAIEEGGVVGCPTEAVGKDGDKYNWKTEPICDWNIIYKKYGIQFDISAPLLHEKKRRFLWWPF